MLFKDRKKKQLPKETRERVIALLMQGESVATIVARCEVSATTVKRIRASLKSAPGADCPTE